MRQLAGRDPEQRVLAAVTTVAAEGSLQVVGIEGPPGIGKSALLEDTTRRLDGWRVLRCHLDPSRSTTRLTAVAELFEPLDWDASFDTPEPSQTARRLREKLEDAATPVCLAIEDAQWLDDPSSDVVLQLIRQMRDLPTLVLLTFRPDPTRNERFRRIAREPHRGRWIDLSPLSLEGIGEVLTTELGVTPDHATLGRIRDVTGGYPIHLEELAHRLVASADPTHTLTTTLAELRDAPPDRLLTQRVADALAAAEPTTRAALLALSLGEGLTWDQTAAVVLARGLETPGFSEVLQTHLVTRTQRETLRPKHAMIAGAVIAQGSDDEIHGTHVALGQVLDGTPGLRHRVRAAHHVDDDPGLVAELEHRSLEHLLFGDAELSFSLAADAATLDPTRTLNAAITAMRVRRLDLAVGLEEPASREQRPLQHLALRALLAAARQDRETARDLVARIDPTECDDETLTVLSYAAHEVSRLGVAQGEYGTAPTTAAIRNELIARRTKAVDEGMPAEFLGEQSNLIGLLGMWWEMASLDPRDGPPLIAALMCLEDELSRWPRTEPTHAVITSVRSTMQFYSGAFELAAAELRPVDEMSVLDPDFILQATYGRFQLLFQAGRWDEAVLAARHALGRTMDRLNDSGRMRLLALGSAVFRCRGEEDPTDISTGGRSAQPRTGRRLVGAARAVAEAWAWVCIGGDPLAVAERLEHAWSDGPGGAYAGGLATAVLRIRAYVAAGMPEAARAATLDLADGTHDEASRDYVIAHSDALVTAVVDPGLAAARFADASEAMARHLGEQPTHGLHIFQALLAEDRVSHLLAHDLPVSDDVRQELVTALTTVRRTGSRPWRARLGVLVRQVDERGTVRALATPASTLDLDLLDDLTSREREISWLVADGLTNREIAAELFLSVRTVESHVARALRKLDCQSRVELRQILRMGRAAH
jgi:DNA-binding CsgD family transcriptional regulator